jgi:bacillithiol biosynthesis deacetylase BshB1
MKKIIAFGAHPDDVEFGVGGLIIKEIEHGSEIKIFVASLGEAGTNGSPEERKNEAESAASHVGAKIEFLELGGDCHIENIPANAIKIAEIIRKEKPHIVLAPSLTSNQHPDHKAMADLVRTACRLARYGGLKEIKDLAVHAVDALYFYPSSAEFDVKPDILVDVSAQYEKWVEAMSLHKSQMKTRSYLNLISSKAKYFGASVGVEYAIGIWINDPVQLDHLSDVSLSSRKY